MNCIIIDDDLMSRRIIEEFISRTDQLRLLASYENAVDAINVFNGDEDIDLIFLDIEMPEMSGIDFLETLTNPTVGLTAHSGVVDIRIASKAGTEKPLKDRDYTFRGLNVGILIRLVLIRHLHFSADFFQQNTNGDAEKKDYQEM